MPAADIVEIAIVGLSYERVYRLDLLVAWQCKHVVEQVIGDAWDGKRGRQQDRCFDLAQLVHLSRTGELAKAVADEHCARHFLAKEIPVVGKDCSDSGADVVAANQRRVADEHALNIGDCVQRAG
jgi:hypothetical protein